MRVKPAILWVCLLYLSAGLLGYMACRWNQGGSHLGASYQVGGASIRACFSPKGDCQASIIERIKAADKPIYVIAYVLTSTPIVDALIEARTRVDVQIILDKRESTGKGNQLARLLQAGMSVKLDSKHNITHDKIIVIEDEAVITGSYNFTRNAEEFNAENLLIIESPSLAAGFLENWRTHESHSVVATKASATTKAGLRAKRRP